MSNTKMLSSVTVTTSSDEMILSSIDSSANTEIILTPMEENPTLASELQTSEIVKVSPSSSKEENNKESSTIAIIVHSLVKLRVMLENTETFDARGNLGKHTQTWVKLPNTAHQIKKIAQIVFQIKKKIAVAQETYKQLRKLKTENQYPKSFAVKFNANVPLGLPNREMYVEKFNCITQTWKEHNLNELLNMQDDWIKHLKSTEHQTISELAKEILSKITTEIQATIEASDCYTYVRAFINTVIEQVVPEMFKLNSSLTTERQVKNMPDKTSKSTKRPRTLDDGMSATKKVKEYIEIEESDSNTSTMNKSSSFIMELSKPTPAKVITTKESTVANSPTTNTARIPKKTQNGVNASNSQPSDTTTKKRTPAKFPAEPSYTTTLNKSKSAPPTSASAISNKSISSIDLATKTPIMPKSS
jgi:hypothetical protein